MIKAPLDKVLVYTTQIALAELFNISPAAVNQWRINGIPANRVIAIETLINKQVTRSEMRPDIFTL